MKDAQSKPKNKTKTHEIHKRKKERKVLKELGDVNSILYTVITERTRSATK